MSIAPFLPGLPMPAAAPEGGTPGEAPAGEPGAAFGDALAAALAGSLVVPAQVPTLPVVEVRGAPAPILETSGPGVPAVPGTALPVVEVRGAAAPSLETSAPGAAAVPSTAAVPVVEAPRPLRPDLLAPSLETSGPGAPTAPSAAAETAPGPQPEVSRLAGAPTSTSEEPAPAQNAAPPSVPPSVTAMAGTVAPTTRPALDLTPDTIGKAVVQQVFPEVTRMASTAGNGTHRITLTLQPEQLGEVRVTLVVRDGSVQVRLAGGDGVEGAAVHRALASGAPELQRLLERTGTDARVSVRDPFAASLPSVSAPSPVQPTSTASQPAFQTSPDAQSRSDPQARHEGHSAREQPTRDQPRQHQSRPTAYPVEAPTVPTGRLDRTV